MSRAAAIALAGSLASTGCGEGLPEIALKLSKNCNEIEITTLVPVVDEQGGRRVLDVAADSALSDSAWILVQRPRADAPDEEDELLVQRISAAGVEQELLLPLPGNVSPALSLRPDPDPGRVWVVRREPGLYAVMRVDPEDPLRPLLGSDDLTSFPDESTLCDPCDTGDWRRELIFLPNGPALVALPPFSIDAGLIVWVTPLSTDTPQIRAGAGHRLNFEPPCDDDTSPEGIAFCEMVQMGLTYPEVTLLGVQQDPRQETTVLFGHRTRLESYDATDFPIESADVFMVTVSLDSGVPAGVLRSYSGFYSGPDFDPNVFSATPAALPPFGVAIDRFASYGLFSNGGVVPRLIQLPNADPDFVELSARVPLRLDDQILQLDRDLGLGRIVDGAWQVYKLFPDDPSQSRELEHQTDAPVAKVVSGGIGTFMLRKQGAPPEIVRVHCPDYQPDGAAP